MLPEPTATAPTGRRPAREGWIRAENALPGSRGWRYEADGTLACVDTEAHVQGYASATSVNIGESIAFHVTVTPAQSYAIAIYRLGWYDGAGGRLLTTSPPLAGEPPAGAHPDPVTGLIACDWPVSWTLVVPDDWVSGLYVAVFTSADRRQSLTPFVVRDDARPAKLCVVLPFTTYQAYNMWPRNGVDGKSLYYGYSAERREDPDLRASKVSFDRPYSDYGLPGQAYYDIDAIEWLERAGYDAVYCSGLDLHAGRVDLSRYDGVVFSGHDEYWSAAMRAGADRAVAGGTSLAFLSANSCYWMVRLETERVVACYKAAPDPDPGPEGATTKWRTRAPGPGNAEQRLLGVQYRAVVPAPVPLVVAAADHWLWAGSGAADGDGIDRLVAGEADGLDTRYGVPAGATQTLVAASPFVMGNGTETVQHASVCEWPDGTVVFVAGTFHWTLGLNREGYADSRIQAATRNLVDRMLAPRSVPPPDPAATPRRMLFYEAGGAPTTRSVRELGTLARAGWQVTVAHTEAHTEAVRELGHASLVLPEPPTNPVHEALGPQLARLTERHKRINAELARLSGRATGIRARYRKLLNRRRLSLTKKIDKTAVQVRTLRAAKRRVAESRARARLTALKAQRRLIADQIRATYNTKHRAEITALSQERSTVAAQMRAIHASRRTYTPLAAGTHFGDLARWEPRWQEDAQEMAAFPADVVWVADLDALPAAVWAAEAMATTPPVIFDSHELFTELEYLPEIYRVGWRQLAERFIPRAAVVLAVSEPITAILREEFAPREAVTLHNHALPGGPVPRGVRDVVGLPPEVRLALHIGHISYARHLKLDAVADLLTGVDDLHLAFVGSADGAIRDDIRAAVDAAGVGDRVHFVDPVPLEQLNGFLQQADISLLLHDGSRSRDNALAMPNKLFDSLAAGLPMLAPWGALPADFLEAEGLGRGYALDKPGDLPAVARELLADTELRERVRRRRAEFTWTAVEPFLVRLVNRVATK